MARLQQDISELKREMKERDRTIQDKVGAEMSLNFIGWRIILDPLTEPLLKKGGVER
jgi:hypothetical protein